jgi:hypothetical protein
MYGNQQCPLVYHPRSVRAQGGNLEGWRLHCSGAGMGRGKMRTRGRGELFPQSGVGVC